MKNGIDGLSVEDRCIAEMLIFQKLQCELLHVTKIVGSLGKHPWEVEFSEDVGFDLVGSIYRIYIFLQFHLAILPSCKRISESLGLYCREETNLPEAEAPI